MITPFPRPLLILIDGSSYLYRAFHALPPLKNAAGEPTGAIYGVLNMIKKLLTDYAPDYIGVIFDAKGKTFRNDLYEDYKAHREVMPDDLISQIEPIHNLINAMGLPILSVNGVEADDVIGTLSQQAVKNHWHVLISTGDKDMAQLVCQHVTLINTMTNTLLDPKGVEAKFGLPPERIIDYLSLVGDSTDNIPGIPSVGPKTAVKWLQEYSNLTQLLENTDKISGKVGERLRENQHQLPLWKTLVTIDQNVPLTLKPEDLKQQPENTPELIKLLKQYEFKNWLNALEKTSTSTKPHVTEQHKTHIITSQSEITSLLKKINSASLIGIHANTTLPDDSFTPLVSLSLFIPEKDFFYLPFSHEETNYNLDIKTTLQQLKPFFENSTILKFGHNLKNIKISLLHHHIQLQGLMYDSLIENHLLHTTQTKQTLDSLAPHFLQKNKTSYEEIAGKGQKKITFDKIPLEHAAAYTSEILELSYLLHQYFWPNIEATPTLKKIYTDIELPLISTLAHIEYNGVLIDKTLLEKQSHELKKRCNEIEESVYQQAGNVFNLASPKQLQEILYEKLKLPILQRTATGQPSTAEDVLEELSLAYPLPKLILEYRSLSKLKSTYTDALPLRINTLSHRIHTSYNQTGTSTGRLSSSEPNLQNIPVRTEEGRRIRKAFIAPENHFIVAADYSQIELRIMAHFSQDNKLLHAFSNKIDIHTATAAEVLGILPQEVTPEQRRQAKVINFGILYGMSAFGLAKQLDVPREAAQDYINLYFSRYPNVQIYIEKTRDFAHQHGYVETLYGRRIYIPEINDRHFQRQKAAERAAINGPLQGTAADIIKQAMNTLENWIQQENNQIKMIMQVHDELVFEVPENIVEKTIKHIRSIMIQEKILSIPLDISIGYGKNWDEAH